MTRAWWEKSPAEVILGERLAGCGSCIFFIPTTKKRSTLNNIARFCINPILLEVLGVCNKHNKATTDMMIVCKDYIEKKEPENCNGKKVS